MIYGRSIWGLPFKMRFLFYFFKMLFSPFLVRVFDSNGMGMEMEWNGTYVASGKREKAVIVHGHGWMGMTN